MLADDQNFFPPYQAVPVVNNKALERVPLLKETLTKLAGKISESEIQKLNGLVDIEHQEIKKVVKDFLATKKF
jgi:osmoprotectant transport system permease protein